MRKAEASDPDVREQLVESARANQLRWRCPHGPGAADKTPLPAPCAEGLERIERVTGASGFTSCPLATLREPWVHEVGEMIEWRKEGALHLRVGLPTLAQAQAMDAWGRGCKARERLDEERRKAKEPKRDG